MTPKAVVPVDGSSARPAGHRRVEGTSEEMQGSQARSGRSCGRPSPGPALVGAHLTTTLAFEGENLGITLVHVAPCEIGVQPAGELVVVGMVGIVEHELAQRTEV